MVNSPFGCYTVVMQVLSATLLQRPIMSLRTGSRIATTTGALINPNNLKIEGFYCQDTVDKKMQLVLLAQDIRDILPAGLVVNDHDVLAAPKDLVRLKEIMNINFELFGKPVITEGKKKLGKVNDFATDMDSLYIQKLYVSQSVIKSLTGGNMGIDRSQIVEITNKKIIVKDPLQLVPSATTATATPG